MDPRIERNPNRDTDKGEKKPDSIADQGRVRPRGRGAAR